MDIPPRPTSEEDPYVFVCYSHENMAEIMVYLKQLSDQGISVWFDEGISPGESWSQEIADAIDGAATFLLFVTTASVESRYCQNEVQYALARRKRIVAVHLAETPLPGGLELNLGASQAILAYRFNRAEVFERLVPALLHHDTDNQVDAISSIRIVRNRHYLYAGVGITLLLGLVAAVLWNFDGGMTFEETQSLAVLPLNNYAEPAYDYLADGLADGLIAQLSKLPEIRVASRASSFSLKKSLDAGELDVDDLRERLSVQYMLEGSITSGSSGSFLVSVRIVNVINDRNVWSGEWDTDQMTLLGIQSEIANQVAIVLIPTLQGAEAEHLLSDVTPNNDAYDAYLRGRDALRKPHTQSNLLEAGRQFERARSLDADFAGAHVGRCEVQLSRYRSDRDPLAFALAQSACNQALALRPDLWEARLALGSLYRASGEYEQSLEEIDIAGEAHPDEATIFSERGWTLDALGREAQAEQAFIEAIKLDPRFWRVYSNLGNFYYNQVQYERALELFREALDLAPGNSTVLHNIGAVQLSLGDFEAALQTYEALREQQDSLSRSMISNIGTTYYNLGCFEEAAMFQQQAAALAPNDHTVMGRLAESCRFVEGRSDSARQLWRRAIELAESSPNQASWYTHGLLAVYRAHVGEFEGAARHLAIMWSLAPEASIAYFFEAIVLSASGDDAGAQAKVRQSLEHGFPPALMTTDPDLNPPPTCPLIERVPLPPETCR